MRSEKLVATQCLVGASFIHASYIKFSQKVYRLIECRWLICLIPFGEKNLQILVEVRNVIAP